ncbi:Uncharacterised protein [Bordetella pertussis]|nr:Uncharacterised protein [Bordetella pertussis]CFW30530.1 Uncharacterised protein [Bordetella pertussis]
MPGPGTSALARGFAETSYSGMMRIIARIASASNPEVAIARIHDSTLPLIPDPGAGRHGAGRRLSRAERGRAG